MGLCPRHWAVANRAGEVGYRDTGPVKAHVRTLQAAGWRLSDIERASGVSAQTIRDLQARSVVLASTTNAILRLQGDPPTGRVSSLGAVRRLDSLQWLGWRATDIAEVAGCTAGELLDMRWVKTIPADLHQKVKAVFVRLMHKPGPSKQAASRARNRGAASPFAWEDIDDPACTPEDPDRVPTGRRRSCAETAEEYEFFRAHRMSDLAIASALGLNLNSLQQALQRARKAVA
jgi:ribosomal protein S11